MENDITEDPAPTQTETAQQPVRVVDDEYVIDEKSGSLRRAFPKHQAITKTGAKRRHHRKTN